MIFFDTKFLFPADGAGILSVAGTVWTLDRDEVSGTSAGDLVRLDGSAKLPAVDGSQLTGLPAIPPPLRGHIFGLAISNNTTDATNDIDIAAGEATSEGTSPALLTLASSLTKRVDAAWAVGSGNGGLDTGSVADGTYHVWLIKRSDTGVVDALFSTSATSPTMPTNYDRKRRLGSFIRSAGANAAFVQFNDKFLLKTPFVTSAATATSGSLITLAGFPTGLRLDPIIAAWNLSGSLITYLSSPDTTDLDPSVNAPPGFEIRVAASGAIPSTGFAANHLMTNTSAQIRHRSSGTGGTLYVATRGWIDARGRLG